MRQKEDSNNFAANDSKEKEKKRTYACGFRSEKRKIERIRKYPIFFSSLFQ